ASRKKRSKPARAMSCANSSSGSSNGNGSPSPTSSASSAKPQSDRPMRPNSTSRRRPWRRRNAAPKRASSRSARAASDVGVGGGVGAEASFDIGVDDRDEVLGDAIPAQGDGLFTVHE